MDDSVNFQFWSSPILDLSLDSFSKEIFQEFDKSVINNDSNSNITILNNQFMPKDSDVTPAPINVITTAEPTTPVNENSEHFIAASPTSSSSVSLPDEDEDDEEEEEETMSTTDIQSPVTENVVAENDEEIENVTTLTTEVPVSTNISRQNSSKSTSSKVESPSDVVVITSEDAPSESADTGVVVQQEQQQQQVATANEEATYTSRQVMTLDATPVQEPSPAPKKSSFFCFSFC